LYRSTKRRWGSAASSLPNLGSRSWNTEKGLRMARRQPIAPRIRREARRQAVIRWRVRSGRGRLTLAPAPQRIRRLPAVNEAVRSVVRHGQNGGGMWDVETARATYQMTPDKESPLWNVHSQVIYWWTVTEADEECAYIIVHDGKVWPRAKQSSAGCTGFRCVAQWRELPRDRTALAREGSANS
jgi:hypothetical protein